MTTTLQLAPDDPSTPSRGGADSPGPRLEVAGGRVKLYRAVGPREANEILRHGEFGYSQHGAGKYFSFTEADARNAAKALYGADVTIVETTVPRAFIPTRPDAPETVLHPHISDPRVGQGATLIRGEAHVFYDPRAGGWSLHVDDGGLDALNKQATRPDILHSPVPTVRGSSGGGGPDGPPPGGGTPRTAGSESPGAAKAITTPSGSPKVTAETGKPVEPVVEATPGFNAGTGAAIGGAVQMLQAMLVGGLQRAEIQKFEKRYAELEPKIGAFLASGYSVELILIVEKPNTVDLLCVGGVYCDADQLTYFRDLYIGRAESVKPIVRPAPLAPTSNPSMGPPGGRDSVIPYTHQGGSIIDESEIPHLTARDKSHHPAYAKQTIYPQESLPLAEGTRPPAQPAKPKPQLDEATKKAMAAAPSSVYILSGNINQYKSVARVLKKLIGNPSFGTVKEAMSGGLNRARTTVVYFSNLDKPRAQELAEIVRAEGVPSASDEVSGVGDDAPGSLQIMFGTDAEK